METEGAGRKPEGLQGELHEMSRQTVEMLRLTREGFRKQNTGLLELAEKLGREIHEREKALTQLAVNRSAGQAESLEGDREIFFVPMHLERIGDNIEFLVRAIKTVVHEGIPFTDRAMKEINELFEQAIGLVESVRDVILTRNRLLMRRMLEEGQRYEEMANEFTLIHQRRLIEGVCMPRASSVYVAIVDYFKGIASHVRQIVQQLLAGRSP